MFAAPSASERLDERQVFADRLRQAIDYRASLGIDATACRLVHGEADRLPALIVDQVRRLARASRRSARAWIDGSGRSSSCSSSWCRPRGILARNDPKVRALEGLESTGCDVVFGDVPETVEVTEGRIRHVVDLRHGQKTGLFLDQQENHAAAARYARGRALDAFSYLGGFALQMALTVRIGPRASTRRRRRLPPSVRAPNGMASRTSRRARGTCSTSCASSRSAGERFRDDRARSAGVRAKQEPPSSAPSPATRRSTCAR